MMSFNSGGNNSEDNFDQNRRHHHNALERKRRGVIKSCFQNLRNVIPHCREKISRAQILSKSIEYITYLLMSSERLDDYIKTYQERLDYIENQEQLLTSGQLSELNPRIEEFCVSSMNELTNSSFGNLDHYLGFIDQQYSSEGNHASSGDSSFFQSTYSSEDEDVFHVQFVNDTMDEFVFIDKNGNGSSPE